MNSQIQLIIMLIMIYQALLSTIIAIIVAKKEKQKDINTKISFKTRTLLSESDISSFINEIYVYQKEFNVISISISLIGKTLIATITHKEKSHEILDYEIAKFAFHH